MKNIALLIPSLTIGGSERSVSNISIALQKHFNVRVIVFDASKNIYKYGGELINLNCPPSKTKLGKIVNIFKRVRKLNKVIKQHNIDVLMSFTGSANIVCSLARHQCKQLISCRGFGDLKDNERKFLKMLKKTDGIVFNSKEMKNYFNKYYPSTKSKTFTLYNIFSSEREIIHSAKYVDSKVKKFIENNVVIVTTGRFCKEKGYESLIEAFLILKEKVSNIRLLFIGDGPLLNQIKEKVEKSYYKDDILFYGYSDNPKEIMKMCDIYALSSYSEGFPNALIEAMQCGLPVVSTNCRTGPSEILLDDYNISINNYIQADYGILSPNFDKTSHIKYENSIKEYSKALELLVLNDNLRKKYSKLSKERVKEYYAENTVKSYIEFFNRL